FSRDWSSDVCSSDLSTGEPLRVGFTRESYERRIAVMYRGYGWSGGHHGRRTLYLWGQPAGGMGWKERLYQSAFQRRTLNAFHMTDRKSGVEGKRVAH